MSRWIQGRDPSFVDDLEFIVALRILRHVLSWYTADLYVLYEEFLFHSVNNFGLHFIIK